MSLLDANMVWLDESIPLAKADDSKDRFPVLRLHVDHNGPSYFGWKHMV